MPGTDMAPKEIKRFQTVVDYTVQNSGTLESLFEVAESNGVGITEDVAPGTVMLAPETETKVTSFYDAKALDITTHATDAEALGGIGYMQIGSSFKVS